MTTKWRREWGRPTQGCSRYNTSSGVLTTAEPGNGLGHGQNRTWRQTVVNEPRTELNMESNHRKWTKDRTKSGDKPSSTQTRTEPNLHPVMEGVMKMSEKGFIKCSYACGTDSVTCVHIPLAVCMHGRSLCVLYSLPTDAHIFTARKNGCNPRVLLVKNIAGWGPRSMHVQYVVFISWTLSAGGWRWEHT